ncbi:MAG TPA: hypothetical protein VGS41_02955 [Chthonomonadales bacterium]|nr:hypothetical protein [Chthonomonadales bacterium]
MINSFCAGKRSFLIAASFAIMALACPGTCQNGPVTLRWKPRLGEESRYRLKVTIGIASPSMPTNMNIDMSMILNQKVTRVLPNGNFVEETTVTNGTVTTGGRAAQIPGSLHPFVMTITPQGTLVSIKGVGPDSPMSTMFGGSSGLTGLTVRMPNHPVRVGQSWPTSLTIPILTGANARVTGTNKLVGFYALGRYRTARLRTGINMPVHLYMSAQGMLVSSASQAAMLMTGSADFAGDTYFATWQGKLVRTAVAGTMDMNIHPVGNNHIAPNGRRVPEARMSLKMSTSIDLIQ